MIFLNVLLADPSYILMMQNLCWIVDGNWMCDYIVFIIVEYLKYELNKLNYGVMSNTVWNVIFLFFL